MASLAVDPGASVLVDGIVAGQADRPVGGPAVEDDPGQDPRPAE
jgi:hypothetical protein